MAIFVIVCLVFSAVFSALSILRGATAHIMCHRKKIQRWEMYERVKTSTKFLTTAFFLAAVGLVIGHIVGQDVWALSNKVVFDLWLVALVFRTRLSIIRTVKSWVKVVIG